MPPAWAMVTGAACGLDVPPFHIIATLYKPATATSGTHFAHLPASAPDVPSCAYLVPYLSADEVLTDQVPCVEKLALVLSTMISAACMPELSSTSSVCATGP